MDFDKVSYFSLSVRQLQGLFGRGRVGVKGYGFFSVGFIFLTSNGLVFHKVGTGGVGQGKV